MKNRRMQLTVVCFAILFLLGFEAGGFQISLLKIVESQGLASNLSGVLVSSQYTAHIVMPLLVGGIADKKGKRRIMTLFSLVFGLGCILMSSVKPFIAMICSAFTIGAGYSVSENMATTILGEEYQEQSGKYLNISQCFFSLGAMVSPQILEFGSANLGWDYKSLFFICGIAGIVVSVAAGFMAKGEVVRTVEAEADSVKIGKEILLLAAALFTYSSLEGGISYYMDGFVTRELAASAHAANMLSLFWFFMIVGRVICGMLYRYRRQLLSICFLGTSASLVALILFPNVYTGYICFSAIGFFLCSIWPNLMGVTVESYEGNSAKAAGIVSAGCGIGAVLSPLMLGVLMDGVGLRMGFGVLAFLAVFGMVCSAAFYKVGPAK